MHRARGKRSGNRRGGYDPHDLEGGSDPQDLEGGSDPQDLEGGFDPQDLEGGFNLQDLRSAATDAVKKPSFSHRAPINYAEAFNASSEEPAIAFRGGGGTTIERSTKRETKGVERDGGDGPTSTTTARTMGTLGGVYASLTRLRGSCLDDLPRCHNSIVSARTTTSTTVKATTRVVQNSGVRSSVNGAMQIADTEASVPANSSLSSGNAQVGQELQGLSHQGHRDNVALARATQNGSCLSIQPAPSSSGTPTAPLDCDTAYDGGVYRDNTSRQYVPALSPNHNFGQDDT